MDATVKMVLNFCTDKDNAWYFIAWLPREMMFSKLPEMTSS